ncbi:Hypothetical_protein [Hexamita inflata]|uniref:Hypothetical_protein n=1 Tax=Hexamita inflata TaxID=28002 RepID=A0AA86PKF2_9EUKA|nr:Hypothetical protein HINF_LOCUS29180 [Hexamita inflata]
MLIFISILTQQICNNLYSRQITVQYCEKQKMVIEQTIILTQSFNTSFTFFLHSEVAKNLKIHAEITASSFSTFSMTGNLVVENCIIKVKATSTLSALLSLAARDVLITDSVLKANFLSAGIYGTLNAAGLSVNSSSITVKRVNLTVDMNTNIGDISGIVSFCPIIVLEQLRAIFTIFTTSTTNSTCGAISAVAQNAAIAISNSTLSGNMYAAADNGYLVGAGINVTIDVSDDSLITITGPQTNNTAHFWSCYGFCERPLPITTVLPVSAVTQIGSSSSCVFTQGTTADNSEVVFDPSRDFSFQGNFSVFGQTASVSNLKVSGRYQVTGELGSYANIFGSNMTDVLVLRKIIIQVSISTLSQCKLNLVTNQISAQFTINSFLANGSFQTEFQTFNAIAVAAVASYTADQARVIVNYQITGEVTSSSALSTLGVQVVKFIDLNIINSFFIINSKFKSVNGLIIGKTNEDQNVACDGQFNFINIVVKKYFNSENMVLPTGIIFNLIVGNNLTIVNFTLSHFSQSKVQQTLSQTIFGNQIVPTMQILSSNILQTVSLFSVQRLGLITFNYGSSNQNMFILISKVIYKLLATLASDSTDIGMLGVADYTANYQYSSVVLDKCNISAQISCPAVQYAGAIVGCAYMQIQAQYSTISDSFINTGLNIGAVFGVVLSGRISSTSITGFETLAEQSGLVQTCTKFIDLITVFLNSIQLTSGGFVINSVLNAKVTINKITTNNCSFSSKENVGVLFNTFSGKCTVSNSQIQIKAAKSTVVNSFVSGSVQISGSKVETTGECFAFVDGKCPDKWVLGGDKMFS